MRSAILRRRVLGAALSAAVAVALLGACTAKPGSPVQPPAQPVYDWEARANTLHVLDDTNDNWACDTLDVNCDEPYLLHLAFRVQYGVADSALTWVVHDRPTEMFCPGAPPSGFLAQKDSCKTGESTAVPAAQGLITFDDLKASDVANLLWKQLPEVAGVITFAFEEDLLSSGDPNTTQLETLVRDLLNENIASGTLGANGQDAANSIVTDLANLFGDLVSGPAITLITGVGLLDDFVGVAPVVIAGVQGGLADLVNLAGLNSIPLMNGRVFTTAADSDFTASYTAQTIEFPAETGFDPIEVGSSTAHYDVDWSVGRP